VALPIKTPGKSTRSWARFAGAGLELAAFAFVFAWLGYVIDGRLGNQRLIVTALGALIGFSLGLVRFIVFAAQVNRESPDSAVEVDPRDRDTE
jgi:hypothetical protein